jgi:hypothetical protein
LARGQGAVLWVEGEPGIGKSALAATGGNLARAAGYEVLWGTGDPISQRFPLRVMLDCLQVRVRSPDPRRAEIAALLKDRRPGLMDVGDTGYAEAELLVSLVDEVCTAGPIMLVIDGLHWDVRTDLRLRGTPFLALDRLSEAESTELVTRLLGTAPGTVVAQIAEQGMGNPLYLRELVDAVRRESTLVVKQHGNAPVPRPDRIPASFTAPSASGWASCRRARWRYCARPHCSEPPSPWPMWRC